MKRRVITITVICVLAVGLGTTPVHGFVAAAVQRAIMIIQQVTQIGHQATQIRQFKDKLDKIREQVDMVKDLKDSTLGVIGELKAEFTSLVSAPTDLVGDAMNWGGEFRGEARRTFDAAQDFGRSGRSLREGWRGRLDAADQVRESDIIGLYGQLPPEIGRRALDAWKRRRGKADSSLVHDHTVADAAAALAKMLKETQASIDKLRNQKNTSATALGQAQVTGLATQGEILNAMAQLQAWEAARKTAKSYQEEVKRREIDARTLEHARKDSRRFDELRPHLKEWGKNLNESILRDAEKGPAWLRPGRR